MCGFKSRRPHQRRRACARDLFFEPAAREAVVWKSAYADLAHLVERHLAKVEVASSSLVIRSMSPQASYCLRRLFFGKAAGALIPLRPPLPPKNIRRSTAVVLQARTTLRPASDLWGNEGAEPDQRTVKKFCFYSMDRQGSRPESMTAAFQAVF